MDRGRYFFAEKDGITYVKMTGNLKYTTSSGFDLCVEGLVERGYQNLVIDLSEALYIDSTNLGMIAKLAAKARESSNVHVSIISPNEDMNEILRSVRFDKLFTIVEEVPDIVEMEELQEQDRSRAEDLRMLVEAHKALMDAHEENRPQFKDVVELLEKEMKDF
jgi:anti-anti-sigma factor